jgi:hypothetical protein
MGMNLKNAVATMLATGLLASCANLPSQTPIKTTGGYTFNQYVGVEPPEDTRQRAQIHEELREVPYQGPTVQHTTYYDANGSTHDVETRIYPDGSATVEHDDITTVGPGADE